MASPPAPPPSRPASKPPLANTETPSTSIDTPPNPRQPSAPPSMASNIVQPGMAPTARMITETAANEPTNTTPPTHPSSSPPDHTSTIPPSHRSGAPSPSPGPPANTEPKTKLKPRPRVKASTEGTRHSKRQRHESPEIVPEDEPKPKRQKPSPSPSTASKPARKPLAPKPSKKSPNLFSLPQHPIPPLLLPCPLPSPYSISILDSARQHDRLRAIKWSYKSHCYYQKSFVKDSYTISMAAGMPGEKYWDRDGGTAFVRCVRCPGDEGGGEEVGDLEGGAEGGKGKGREEKRGGKGEWNCVRPMVSDIWVSQRGQISWSDQISPLTSSTRRGVPNPLKPRLAAEFFRRSSPSGEKDFYFWWPHSHAVKVNGLGVILPNYTTEDEGGPDVAFGPLPDFAIIQVKDAVMFFWKNEGALRYLCESAQTDLMKVEGADRELKRRREEEERKRREAEDGEGEERQREKGEEAERRNREARDAEEKKKEREAEDAEEAEKRQKEAKSAEETMRKEEQEKAIAETLKKQWEAKAAEDTVKRQKKIKAAEETAKRKKEAKAAAAARQEEEIMRFFQAQQQQEQLDPLDEALLGENDELPGLLPMADPAASQRIMEEARRDRWMFAWQGGVDKNERRRRRDPNATGHRIESWRDLTHDDVHLGIATLWNTITSQPDGRQFAFNDAEQYQIVRGSFVDAQGRREKCMAAVNGPNDLLIPMVMDGYSQSPPNSAGFPPGQDPNDHKERPPPVDQDDPDGDKGAVGHTVFVVAQRVGKDPVRGDQIRAIVMDSRPGAESNQRIKDNIGKTIRRIGWLGMDKNGRQVENRDAPPELVEVQTPQVPHQISENSCGIHAILHAWAYMLGLPALDSDTRLNGKTYTPEEESKFINDALRMINLALVGHMDLYTIQAFFNYSGFCQLQDPNDRSVQQPETTFTATMNGKILMEIMEERRAVAQPTSSEPTESRFPERDIMKVKDKVEGVNYSGAVHLLETADGDVDMAVNLGLNKN